MLTLTVILLNKREVPFFLMNCTTLERSLECWCHRVDKRTNASARETVTFCCCVGLNAAQVITYVSFSSTVQSCDELWYAKL